MDGETSTGFDVQRQHGPSQIRRPASFSTGRLDSVQPGRARDIPTSQPSPSICKRDRVAIYFRVVFQVLQTIEGFDRLLIELPGQVSSLWQERNELRNVHGSVCAMCYYYNYIVQGKFVQQLTSSHAAITQEFLPGYCASHNSC